MTHRTSGGFSCFTIDALIGNTRCSPRPQVSDAEEWSSSTSSILQYVVSCSRLEDVSRSPAPTTATTTTTLTYSGQDHQRQSVQDVAAESRHAFRVYRPASLDGVAAASSTARTPDSADLPCGILATLQRRAMRWYSNDVDSDHWRTPTLCDLPASRGISDIISTPMSSADHPHRHCEYR